LRAILSENRACYTRAQAKASRLRP